MEQGRFLLHLLATLALVSCQSNTNAATANDVSPTASSLLHSMNIMTSVKDNTTTTPANGVLETTAADYNISTEESSMSHNAVASAISLSVSDLHDLSSVATVPVTPSLPVSDLHLSSMDVVNKTSSSTSSLPLAGPSSESSMVTVLPSVGQPMMNPSMQVDSAMSSPISLPIAEPSASAVLHTPVSQSTAPSMPAGQNSHLSPSNTESDSVSFSTHLSDPSVGHYGNVTQSATATLSPSFTSHMSEVSTGHNYDVSQSKAVNTSLSFSSNLPEPSSRYPDPLSPSQTFDLNLSLSSFLSSEPGGSFSIQQTADQNLSLTTHLPADGALTSSVSDMTGSTHPSPNEYLTSSFSWDSNNTLSSMTSRTLMSRTTPWMTSYSSSCPGLKCTPVAPEHVTEMSFSEISPRPSSTDEEGYFMTSSVDALSRDHFEAQIAELREEIDDRDDEVAALTTAVIVLAVVLALLLAAGVALLLLWYRRQHRLDPKAVEEIDQERTGTQRTYFRPQSKAYSFDSSEPSAPRDVTNGHSLQTFTSTDAKAGPRANENFEEINFDN